MERHHRVSGLEAVLDVHRQNAMLGGRVAAVGPEQVLHGVPIDSRAVDAGTEREDDGSAFDAEGIGGPASDHLLSGECPASSTIMRTVSALP
jgi:hypothetical protein